MTQSEGQDSALIFGELGECFVKVPVEFLGLGSFFGATGDPFVQTGGIRMTTGPAFFILRVKGQDPEEPREDALITLKVSRLLDRSDERPLHEVLRVHRVARKVSGNAQ